MTPDSLIERRILDGPNRHLPRPAIQLRLDAGRVLALPADACLRAADELQMDETDVGEPGSDRRHAFVRRFLVAATKALADRGGVHNLHVLTRRGHTDDEVMVVYPWRRLGPAELLGTWVAYALDDVGDHDLRKTVAKGGRRLQDEPDGERPDVITPGIPTVGITGTNGKTTTTRLLAHIGRAARMKTAWNNTDGIYVDGRLIEAGDYAGFRGAQTALRVPGVEFAVIEAARGGILNRGLGVRHVDVAIVTNVTADHLGLSGVDTLDELAEVKATVPRAVRRGGWVVLNAEDPRVIAMRHGLDANVFAFALDRESPVLAEVVRGGGRGCTIVDGDIVIVEHGVASDVVVPIAEVPLTVGGRSPHMVANALAATAAAVALGLPRAAILDGLRTFGTELDHNPGRMNLFQRDDVVVVADIAHNEESLEALLTVARGLVALDGTLHASIGSIGDRTDEVIRGIGAIAGKLADRIVIAHKDKYLRERDKDELLGLLTEGVVSTGAVVDEVHEDEPAALAAMLERARPGDVIAFAMHTHYQKLGERLLEAGFSPLQPGGR